MNGASRVGLGAVAIAMLAAPVIRPAGGQPRAGDPSSARRVPSAAPRRAREDGTPIGSLEIFDPAGRMRSAVDFGADGRERSRRAWDEANREIDPRSPEARDAEARAVASSRLIQIALMAASVRR